MAFYLFAEWAAIFRPLVLFPSNLIRAWCEARVPGLWKHRHDPKVRLADNPEVGTVNYYKRVYQYRPGELP